jgi:hypothetical protein
MERKLAGSCIAINQVLLLGLRICNGVVQRPHYERGVLAVYLVAPTTAASGGRITNTGSCQLKHCMHGCNGSLGSNKSDGLGHISYLCSSEYKNHSTGTIILQMLKIQDCFTYISYMYSVVVVPYYHLLRYMLKFKSSIK